MDMFFQPSRHSYRMEPPGAGVGPGQDPRALPAKRSEAWASLGSSEACNGFTLSFLSSELVPTYLIL